MAGIFISYRRDDTLWCAGRLFDRLADAFGPSRVFMDVESLDPAKHFAVEVRREVETSDIVLVLIGADWLRLTDAQGRRRIDNPNDLVRLEIASALSLERPIIPVLVEGAPAPSPEDLPEDIRGLCDSTFFDLEHGKFQADSSTLISLLRAKTTPDPSLAARKLESGMRRAAGPYVLLAAGVRRFGPAGLMVAAAVFFATAAVGSHLLAYMLTYRAAFAEGQASGQSTTAEAYEGQARKRRLEQLMFKGVVTDGSGGLQGAQVVVENRRDGRRSAPVESVVDGRYNVDLSTLLSSDEDLVRLFVTMPGYSKWVDEFTLRGGFEYRSVLLPVPAEGQGRSTQSEGAH
jgi:hypothetical protein